MTTTTLTLEPTIEDGIEEVAAQSVRAIEALAVRSVQKVASTREAGAIAFAVLYLVASLLCFASFAPALRAEPGPGVDRAAQVQPVHVAEEAAPCDAPPVKVEPIGMCLAH